MEDAELVIVLISRRRYGRTFRSPTVIPRTVHAGTIGRPPAYLLGPIYTPPTTYKGGVSPLPPKPSILPGPPPLTPLLTSHRVQVVAENMWCQHVVHMVEGLGFEPLAVSAQSKDRPALVPLGQCALTLVYILM